MAIQNRRGLKRDFDPQKMLPGEWAVSTDPETENQIIWMCFRPGVVKRMGTYEDFKEQIREATDDIREEYEQSFNEIKVYMEGLKNDTEGYKNTSVQKATEASQSAMNAYKSATNSANSADSSEDYSLKSKSYAIGTGGEVRPNDDSDCAEYYYEQVKRISQQIQGVIQMGAITFAELSLEKNQVVNYMFNISDDFVSDERFKDGGGVYYGAGSNVVRTGDEMWDVLAAPSVFGVKGNAESVYRQGLVNLTPEDIGAATIEDLENVNPDFVGTREEMQAKLDAGELKDGANVYLTDVGKKGTLSDGKVYFEEALERENIISGESLAKAFGKIEKWFTDLAQAANVINSVKQELAGQGVLDAAVGAYLDGKKFDVDKIVDTADVTEPGYVVDALKNIEWLNTKQNDLMLGSNTIKDFTSLFVGCEWYNTEKITDGEVPFYNYGMILSLKATTNTLMQLAIPYGLSTDYPKWRSRVNSAWQPWKFFSSFQNTKRLPDSGSNLDSYTDSGSYFKPVFTKGSDTNYPYEGAGWLEVYTFVGTTGTVFNLQRYTVWGTTLVYTRFHNANGWTPWKQVGGLVSEVYKLNTNYANNLEFSRVGSAASFTISTPKNLKASGETLIGTVPANFRPHSKCIFNIFEGGSPNNQVRILFDTNGQFSIWNYSTKTGEMNITDTLTYLTTG